jgi:hypothetical protein
MLIMSSGLIRLFCLTFISLQIDILDLYQKCHKGCLRIV